MIITEIVRMKTVEGITKDDLKDASKKIFIDKDAENFVTSINNQSVKMLILPQVSAWVNSL